jgi:hypothetical protein
MELIDSGSVWAILGTICGWCLGWGMRDAYDPKTKKFRLADEVKV